jgi:hypothetical protein
MGLGVYGFRGLWVQGFRGSWVQGFRGLVCMGLGVYDVQSLVMRGVW